MDISVLSLVDWLGLFDKDTVSKSFFFNNYKVKSVKKIVPLKTYMLDNNIDISILETLYHYFVVNKEPYLVNFYNKSLKIYPCYFEKLEQTFNNNKNPKFKNLVRNIYYKDILLLTQTEISNSRPYLEVLFDLFNNNIIDYKLLTPSARAMFEKKQFGNILSGFYFRSSILNPSVIYSLSKVLNGTRVFTPTLGWSSYMLGFLSNSKVTEYVGTDVIPEVCNNTKYLANMLFPKKKIDIYCCPSEKLFAKKTFSKKYKSNYFDTVFFSPPYFKLEIYRGVNQSTRLYSDYGDWLKLYWEKTIKLCRRIIKHKGKLCYIISNYANKQSMNDDMNTVTKKYFKLSKTISLGNSNVSFTKHRPTGEVIFIFKPL